MQGEAFYGSHKQNSRGTYAQDTVYRPADKKVSVYDHIIPQSHCRQTTKIVMSMIRKYQNHKLQTTPWHREEEPLNHHETPGRQIKQSNRLSLPIKMIAILEWT